jgi:hypothetical protein
MISSVTGDWWREERGRGKRKEERGKRKEEREV